MFGHRHSMKHIDAVIGKRMNSGHKREEGATLIHLPKEVLLLVFRHLTLIEKIQLRMVCNQTKDACDSLLNITVRFKNSEKAEGRWNTFIKDVRYSKRLYGLVLDNWLPPANYMTIIPSNLQYLKIYGSKILFKLLPTER